MAEQSEQYEVGTVSLPSQGRALVILNPAAGPERVAAARQALATVSGAHDWQHVIYETTGDDDLSAQIARQSPMGLDLVVAAGGDGTVSAVVQALLGSGLPLGILPLGTANVLALELGIPGDLNAAAQLLAGPHARRRLDLMRVEQRHYVLQIGIGLDSLMIRDTDRAAKQRWGRLAYLRTLADQLRRHTAHRYTLLVDGRRQRLRARQVLVANGGTLGAPPLRWGPDIAPDDGQLDLCLWRSRTLRDYRRQLWLLVTGRPRQGSVLTCEPIRHYVIISADRALPVQADGEIIGQTPVRVDLVPGAIEVIVPVATV